MGQSSRDQYTVIDITDAERVLSAGSFMSSECCIFKVPNILYRHDPNAYVPNAFSIGPLHRHHQHLKATEEMKVQYLNGLISRGKRRTPKQTLENLIQAVSKIEERARRCYSVPLNYTKKEFESILVLDGCFIIELFLRHVDRVKDDPVFDMACWVEFLRHDLILLENQIPWFVLGCLFKAVFLDFHPLYSLTQLAIGFFKHVYSNESPLSTVDNSHGSKHILDLLRNALVLSTNQERGHFVSGWNLIPSATNLKEAGIKFRKGESSNILNITFNGGVLEIPSLVIQETTNVIFRNLIAFEQCYPKCSPKITSYAILLNNLIASTKDLSILREEEIIDNWLNLDECFHILSKLYNDTFVKEFYYVNLCNDVSEYCQRSWPRWRAAYLHNHFGKPWAIISQIIGGSVLLLTFLQTYYTIKK